MDLAGGLAQSVAALPAEFQPVLMALMDRIAQLETQSAKDANAIADKLIAAILPQIQALTQTANEAISETLALTRRIDGATVTLRLKPVNDADTSVGVKSE